MNASPLFIACGVVNAVFTAFHLLLARQIHRAIVLPGERALLQALNVGGVLLIAFLAFAFLACPADLRTRLGKATILLGALLYLTRAIDEVVLFPHVNAVIVGGCALVGALHLLALRAAGPKRG
jgi:hypothetical protein